MCGLGGKRLFSGRQQHKCWALLTKQLRAAVVSSHYCKGGSSLIWASAAFILARILLKETFSPYEVCAVTAFKNGYEFYDLKCARNVNGATEIKELCGPGYLLPNQRVWLQSKQQRAGFQRSATQPVL